MCENIDMSNHYKRPPGKGWSSNRDWNPGEPVPVGAELPYDAAGKTRIVSAAGSGAGTLAEPRVEYRNRPNLAAEDRQELDDFARKVCKDLGFTHIWIRMGVHSWKAERDPWSRKKTGDRQFGEDDHITVYLANKENWVNVHGDIYVTTKIVEGGLLPVKLMLPEKLKIQEEGKPPRVLRLYVWDESSIGGPSEGYQKAMSSGNWRSRGK